jgi:hypothetical protein
LLINFDNTDLLFLGLFSFKPNKTKAIVFIEPSASPDSGFNQWASGACGKSRQGYGFATARASLRAPGVAWVGLNFK